MSFSSGVKEELSQHIGKARHCRLAELAAFYYCEGTEQPKYFTLLKKTISIDECVEDVLRVAENPEKARADLLQQICCKRAFLRGAFLASGSMSDPEKGYHFEIVCRRETLAEQIQEQMHFFDIGAKVVERKGRFVVYLKEASEIVDALNVMEASVALMNLENIRILKEVRNTVNRKVNCETANINKTVNAAVRQIEDIQYIEEQVGLSTLPENLQIIARLRLEHQDSSLVDLGEMLDPPVGKSGVNHRLRRISGIADKLRGTQA